MISSSSELLQAAKLKIAATAKAIQAIRNAVFIASAMVDLLEQHDVNRVTVQ